MKSCFFRFLTHRLMHTAGWSVLSIYNKIELYSRLLPATPLLYLMSSFSNGIVYYVKHVFVINTVICQPFLTHEVENKIRFIQVRWQRLFVSVVHESWVWLWNITVTTFEIFKWKRGCVYFQSKFKWNEWPV